MVLPLLLLSCSGAGRKPAPAASAKAEAGVAEMSVEAQRRVRLGVAPVKMTLLAESLQVTGSVQPANSRVAQVRSLTRGRVQEVLARVGDRVTAGQTLARIDNMEAGELAAQLSSARAELARLRVLQGAQARQAERKRQLFTVGAVAEREYDQTHADEQAAAANMRSQESVIAGLEARLKRFGVAEASPGVPVITAIPAPFAGVVTEAHVSPGQTIESTSELFMIANLSEVWVQAEVFEKDLGRIRLGQPAAISVDTYPGERFRGRVTYISDILDHHTRTAKVRCEVANRDLRLKLDMFATVLLPTTFSRRTLAVPVGALQQLDGKDVIFVKADTTRFEARAVKIGRSVDGLVEISSGLREGEVVVVEGAFHLKSILAGKDLGEE